jgi:TolA-binding protein
MSEKIMQRANVFSRWSLAVLVMAGLLSSGCAYMPWASSTEKDDDLSFDENALFSDDTKDAKGGKGKGGDNQDFFGDEDEKGDGKGAKKGAKGASKGGKKADDDGFASLDQGGDTGEMKTDVGSLQKQQQELSSKVRQLEEVLAQLQPKLDAAQGKLKGGLGAAAEKSEMLAPEINELKMQIAKLNDEMGQMKGKRAKTPAGVGGGGKAASGKKKQEGPIPAEYVHARDLYLQGKHDQSLLAFQKLSGKNSPEGLQDNIIYWMGANRFKLEMYDEAIRDFETVITKFPHGNKIHDAMFLLSLSYEKKGDKAKAVDILEGALKHKPNKELRDKMEQKLADLR